MVECFIALFAGHVMGDFVFQTDRMFAQKRQPGILLFHVFIVSLLSAACLLPLIWGGSLVPLAIVFTTIFLTHLVFDALKIWLNQETALAFVIDQIAHIGVLCGLALLYPVNEVPSWRDLYLAVLVVIAAVFLTTRGTSFLISKLIAPFAEQVNASGQDSQPGLARGGQMIGYLERLLVLLLVLIELPSGIGFLIATKSILRFGNTQGSESRAMSEYIIIGTFMSFAFAIGIAYGAYEGLSYLFEAAAPPATP